MIVTQASLNACFRLNSSQCISCLADLMLEARLRRLAYCVSFEGLDLARFIRPRNMTT